MKQIFGNALRNVKEFFTEPVLNFQFEELQQDTNVHDPLFDQVELAPTAAQSQPGNQAAVLNALARATENYFLTNIAPLLRNVPQLRWQIKQIQICETVDNSSILTEINQLSPSILNTVSKAVLAKLPCAHAMDLSHYYGLCIVPTSELIGRAVVTWASIGQEKTAMQFYFDDEIIECQEAAAVVDTPVSAAPSPVTEFPADVAVDFHLKLIDDNGARELRIKKFPAIAGSAATADLQVSGKYVSAHHLVLHWDAVLQCVYLTDRSRHGTFLKNGCKLADGERSNLLGAGSFKLTNQVNAPRFEYWHGAAPSQGTELLPPDVCEALQTLANNRANNPGNNGTNNSTNIRADQAAATPAFIAGLRRPASAGASPLAAFTKSLRSTQATQADQKNQTDSAAASGAATRLISAAQGTLLADNDKPRPLAWLQVRNAKKQVDTVAITALPFSIGREFVGDGYPIDESYIKVSRVHLRLLEQRGASFGVNNDSLQRPGKSNITFGEKGAESHKFVWTPHPRNSDSGWRVLGASRLDAESIEVRLLAADKH